MNKLFSKFINYGFGAFFTLITVMSAYFLAELALSKKGTPSGGETAGFAAVLLIAAGAVCIGLHFLGKLFEKKLGGNEKMCGRIFLCMAVLLLAAQIAFAAASDFAPKNDLKYVCTAAENYVTGGVDTLYNGLPERHQNYFSVYPNNHALFLIVLAAYKIQYALTGTVTNLIPIALNIVGMNLSYLLMYKCARLIYSPEKSLMCAVKGLMFTPLVTYSPFFYTDGMSMPWLTGAIYLYMKWRAEMDAGASAKKLTALALGCGAVLGVAYKIKGSAVILIPAILLDLLFRQKGLKDKLLPIAETAAAFALVSVLIGNIACSVLKISDEEIDRHSFPAIHWVMMSADGDGGYSYDDFKYTKSFESHDEKVSADIDRLKEKISDQGASGFMNHLALKLTYTWKNGTFMIPYYLPDCRAVNSESFYITATLLHFTLLLSMSASYLSKLRSDNDVLSGNFFLKVTLMGLTLFLMIWEARCRYLVSFFPLFALI